MKGTTKRISFNLDGLWGYKRDEERVGYDLGYKDGFIPDKSVVVPSCMINEDEMSYRGLSWFTTEFRAEGLCEFKLDGLLETADVFVDGEHMASHYGGFTEFRFVKRLSPSVHKIVVALLNDPNDKDTIPLDYVDWYHYGGISRSVTVTRIEKAYVKDVKFNYVLSENLKDATISPEITLLSDGEDESEVEIALNGEVIARATLPCDGRPHAISPVKTAVKLWSTSEPNLYDLSVSTCDDELVKRVGFRKVEIKGDRILLNGEELYLKGVNRHDEHPDWGFAMPVQIIKTDLDTIKGMGMNTVRGSHYPNNKAVLEYCDEIGLVFWEEIPMWTYSKDHLSDELVLERASTMLREMIERDIDHPSIIMWGVHNEVDTDTEEGRRATERLVKVVRECDSTRPVTYASNRLFCEVKDICHDLVDIIAINTYPCWYPTEKTKKKGLDITEWYETLDEIFEDRDKNYPNMPVIISEFGAGGIYGVVEREPLKWTENYQDSYFEGTLPILLNDKRLSGFYVWQYADIRCSERNALSRPRSYNNKGLVNEYRKPKMAYYTVKRILNGEK